MATDKVASGDTILASKENDITIGTTAPTSPTTGWIWVDTSGTSPVLKKWNGSAWEFDISVYKYKTASQSFVTTTTYADITATTGNLAFAIGANEVWEVEWHLYVTTEVAGGYKFQVTGPATPTAVQLGAGYQGNEVDNVGTGQGRGWNDVVVRAIAFSGNILSVAGGVGTGLEQRVGTIVIRGLIVNGANAGTITLQGAQNSASGTTTINAGHMVARRLFAA